MGLQDHSRAHRMAEFGLRTSELISQVSVYFASQMDLQAQDRAHRIGQTREVRVLRLIGSDTLEEDIQIRVRHASCTNTTSL